MVMATISENLQTIVDSTAAIKQAIIDKGGTIEGDITTWASAISGIESGTSSKELLLFKIGGLTETRVFEYGMTFGEWVGSIYNISSAKFGQFVITGDNRVATNIGYLYETNADTYVYSSDMIYPIIYTTYVPSSGGAD